MFASRLAQIEIDLQNLEITNLRTLASVENGEAPGAESSIIKILGSEIEQDIDNLTRKSTEQKFFLRLLHTRQESILIIEKNQYMQGQTKSKRISFQN